jgi:hypothetical protein
MDFYEWVLLGAILVYTILNWAGDCYVKHQVQELREQYKKLADAMIEIAKEKKS